MDATATRLAIAGAATLLGLIGSRRRARKAARSAKAAAAPPSVLEQLREELTLSTETLAKLAEDMQVEMRAGLAGEPSSLKMIPSYVTALPDGSESGCYYALDLGGSNFRVAKVKLSETVGGAPEKTELKCVIPKERMAGTGEALFDFIAACVAEFLASADGEPEGDEVPSLGFTFSFPVQQTSLAGGHLIRWTKDFTASGVEGVDVTALLSAALQRAGVRMNVKALVNDTVGTLVCGRYSQATTCMGVILGTGTNAAYVEQLSRISKFDAEAAGLAGEGAMVINMEWGSLGDGGSLLPRCRVDDALDQLTKNVGEQWYEKMISGLYLGEMVRLALVAVADDGHLLAGAEEADVAASLRSRGWLTSAMASRMAADSSDDCSDVATLLDAAGLPGSSVEDRRTICAMCRLVGLRAARLTAAGIAAVLRHTGDAEREDVTVGVDGSVFELFAGFQAHMLAALAELGITHASCVLAKDGSGLGAAIIVAAAE